MAFATFDEVRVFFNHGVVHDTDGTSNISLLANVPYAVRVDTWLAISFDTVAREFVIQVTDASLVFQVLAHFTVPAGVGTGGIPPFDVLGAILPATTQGLVLPPSTQVEVAALVALSAGKYAAFTLLGGSF